MAPAPSADLPEAFRRLYYRLYSGGRASRAERILEDISLLLLLKLAIEDCDAHEALQRFLQGKGDSSTTLLPVLRATYPDLVVGDQGFSIGDDALRDALNDLASISLSTAPAHVLGEAFQALLGPRLRGDRGQFFTPRTLVGAMVQILAPTPEESVADPAAGTGGFLAEAHAYQARNSIPSGRLLGLDKDQDLSRLASALLRVATRDRAHVWNTNSLNRSEWPPELQAYAANGFDVVLTNPPFGARIGIRDPRILREYDLGHQWAGSQDGWEQTGLLLSAQDPQVLFVELCVKLLRPGGRLGIVLPEGLFGNRGDAYIWHWLAAQGRVLALLDCPRTTFQPGTDTKTNVLFFQRSSSPGAKKPRLQQDVRIAVALTCGHDRRGRNRRPDGSAYPDDFPRLGAAFGARKPGQDGWRKVEVTLGQYLVPRYFAEEGPTSDGEAALTRGATFTTLGDLIKSGALEIRKGHEVGSDAYGTGDVPFVRTSDISNLEISTDPTKSVADDIYQTFSRQQSLEPGDILMVVDGRYRIGATAMLTENNSRCVVQSHVRIIAVRRGDVVTPFELLYALNLPSVRLRIRDLVFVQSTLGTLGRRLLELRIPLFHGDGPWRASVDRFAAILIERDRLLSELRPLTATTVEL